MPKPSYEIKRERCSPFWHKKQLNLPKIETEKKALRSTWIAWNWHVTQMVQHCEDREYIGSVSISAHKMNSPDAPNVSNRLTIF